MAGLQDFKSTTWWMTATSSAALIGQLFTASGNPTLAMIGAGLVGLYTIVRQIEKIATANGPPQPGQMPGTHMLMVQPTLPDLTNGITAAAPAVEKVVKEVGELASLIRKMMEGYQITPIGEGSNAVVGRGEIYNDPRYAPPEVKTGAPANAPISTVVSP